MEEAQPAGSEARDFVMSASVTRLRSKTDSTWRGTHRLWADTALLPGGPSAVQEQWA